MNKTIIININNIVFHIEEDAYEVLRAYMIEIKRHFGKSEDSKEILEDIENRIAEMFAERITSGRKEVIIMEDVNQVIAQMGRVSDFEDVLEDEEATAEANEGAEGSGEEDHTSPFEGAEQMYFTKKLMRDPDGKVFFGVCSGLAYYFNMDAKIFRIIFVLLFLFGGSSILAYIVLCIVMPVATSRADKMSMRGEAPNLQNFKKSFESDLDENNSGGVFRRWSHSIGTFVSDLFRVFGKILAVVGLLFAGLSVVGMFIFFVFNVLNLIGFDNPIYFPPLQMMDSMNGFLALLAGFLGITIPFIALFFVLLRVLLKTRPLNNFASMTMFTTWVISVLAIIYFSISTNHDFQERSTIKVEKSVDRQAHYIISSRDVRIIDASTEDFTSKKLRFKFDQARLKDMLYDDVHLSIESVDSLQKPFVEFQYKAKGRDFKSASNRASDIKYVMEQKGEQLVFDSHFSIPENELYRDQRVDITLYMPVGTQFTIMNDLDRLIQNVGLWDCFPQLNGKSTEWVMTERGLQCATEDPEEKENDD